MRTAAPERQTAVPELVIIVSLSVAAGAGKALPKPHVRRVSKRDSFRRSRRTMACTSRGAFLAPEPGGVVSAGVRARAGPFGFSCPVTYFHRTVRLNRSWAAYC